MAFEQRFARIEESKVFYLNYKAPPVVSERHTIIEDCHGMQFHYNSPMAPQKVIVNPADQYFNATKEEYQGSSRPKTTSYASLPPGGYYPQVVSMGNQVPNLTKRPIIHGNVEVPQTVRKPITSEEAVKLYGGFVVTEFRPKKQCHMYWA